MGGKKDKYKYDMALEVARQPADTPEGKRMKKDAQNYVRAFESRFQNEAFVRSGRMPYTAGGKGAAKDLEKVDKVGKSKPAPKKELKKATEKMKKNTRVKITGTASTTPRVSGSMIKSQPKTTSKSTAIKVTKKMTEAPKRTPKNAQTLRRFAKGGKK
jgi:TusA-related sulfurtransferase